MTMTDEEIREHWKKWRSGGCRTLRYLALRNETTALEMWEYMKTHRLINMEVIDKMQNSYSDEAKFKVKKLMADSGASCMGACKKVAAEYGYDERKFYKAFAAWNSAREKQPVNPAPAITAPAPQQIKAEPTSNEVIKPALEKAEPVQISRKLESLSMKELFEFFWNKLDDFGEIISGYFSEREKIAVLSLNVGCSEFSFKIEKTADGAATPNSGIEK